MTFSALYIRLNYTQYKRKNYPIFPGASPTGTSNNLSLRIALQRSSVFDPIFPTSGSNFVASVQFTPPYSLFNPNIVKSSIHIKTRNIINGDSMQNGMCRSVNHRVQIKTASLY